MCLGVPFPLWAGMEVPQLQSRCLVSHSVHPKFLAKYRLYAWVQLAGELTEVWRSSGSFSGQPGPGLSWTARVISEHCRLHGCLLTVLHPQ